MKKNYVLVERENEELFDENPLDLFDNPSYIMKNGITVIGEDRIMRKIFYEDFKHLEENGIVGKI